MLQQLLRKNRHTPEIHTLTIGEVIEPVQRSRWRRKPATKPMVGLRDAQVLQHTIIIGQAITGKTRLTRNLAGQAMAAGASVLYLDYRRDAELAMELAEIALEKEFADIGSARFKWVDPITDLNPGYNPLHIGDIVNLADRLGRYLPECGIGAIALEAVIGGLLDIGEPGHLPRILQTLQSVDRLQTLANREELHINTRTHLNMLLDQYRSSHGGLLHEQPYLRDIGDFLLGLQALTDPELAPVLGTVDESFNLEDALQDRGTIHYMGLDAASPGRQLFRRLVINDLREAVSRRYPRVAEPAPAPLALVVLDGLPVQELEHLAWLTGTLEMARVARVGFVLNFDCRNLDGLMTDGQEYFSWPLQELMAMLGTHVICNSYEKWPRGQCAKAFRPDEYRPLGVGEAFVLRGSGEVSRVRIPAR
ncbi:hypothetical protein [Acidithiobacillus ferriphilus]|uniref:hypothetical protein n=1 Tax=Acidithiobacillus ferriphilus TaxID=1689834 RepID=UPI002DB9B866|nr:hypothetical protein [Acidithiobacillus ferriphilus]MEB8474258.1 hypothetical protein [Acidithiobacillus ferriphilus]